MQSTLRRSSRSPRQATGRGPLHVAVILDGNGRWAERRGLPRSAGHRAGARAVRRTVEAAARRGIDILTLFAFSADNWRRPRQEVASLMTLLGRYLAAETGRCVDNGVHLEVIGRRDRLDPRLVTAIDKAERATAGGGRLRLRIAVDYSARQTLAAAASLLAARHRGQASGAVGADGPEGEVDAAALEAAIATACHSTTKAPVDLLIRTSGEQRLSDFLLWECAYAELHFTPTLWPDFDEAALAEALAEYENRERRFGRLPEMAKVAAVAGKGV